MPCSVRTLKPCQWGRVSRPATGEFLGTMGIQGEPTVTPYAPLTPGPNSPLNQRYGPAIIPCQAQEELFAGSKICLAPKYVPS